MHSNTLELIYIKYYKIAYIYTFSLCKNKEIAEDIVSESFYKAFITLDDEKENFSF